MKYTHKPIEIEAVQYKGNGNFDTHALPDWIWAAFEDGTLKSTNGTDPLLMIHTENVVHPEDFIVKLGDLIIHCHPDIFHETYSQSPTTEADSEWSKEYTGQRGQAPGDKCLVHDGDAMRNAVVDRINHKEGTYDAIIEGLGTKISNIPLTVWRPLTALSPSDGQDGWVREEDLKPEHKCKIIARAFMGEGRDWWLGELIEKIPEWPNETHCLHLKTPLKDIVLLCNSGDFTNLSVLIRHALGYVIDESWMQTQLKMTAENLPPAPNQ